MSENEVTAPDVPALEVMVVSVVHAEKNQVMYQGEINADYVKQIVQPALAAGESISLPANRGMVHFGSAVLKQCVVTAVSPEDYAHIAETGTTQQQAH